MAGIKNRVDAARKAEAEAAAEAEAKAKAEAEAKEKAEAEAAAAAAAQAEAEGEGNPDAKCSPDDPKHKGNGKDDPDDEEDEEDMAAKARTDAAAISQLCADAGVPNLAAKLIAEGLDADGAKARIEAASEIRGLVARARRINPAIDPKVADDFIATGASLGHAKEDLFDRIVSMQSEDIRNAHAPDARPNGAAVDHGWGDAIAKVTRSRTAK